MADSAGLAMVTTAVANGDLSQKITVDASGEILELKNTINTMVDQLDTFAGEVARIAREVGTEGKLGGQAVVKGVSGTWKDLTDSVNTMASSLTDQVRGIVTVVTAVANGDLKKKLTVEAHRFSGSASAKIEATGGTVKRLGPQPKKRFVKRREPVEKTPSKKEAAAEGKQQQKKQQKKKKGAEGAS